MSELKIGIIGTDGGIKSGHAVEILRLLYKKNKGARVVGIYGEEDEPTKELFCSGMAERVVSSPDELMRISDAVMILNRDGRKHYNYAEPFIRNAMPVFIDKPVSCDLKEAYDMQNMAVKSASVLMGGSYMKYSPIIEKLKDKIKKSGEILSGYFSFPVFLDSEYGGIHFYSHHLIEEMITVFGTDIKMISASVTNGKLVATAHYETFPVIMNYSCVYPGFYAGVNTSRECFMEKVYTDSLNEKQLDLFIDAAKKGKGMNDIYSPVKISCALEKAIIGKKDIML